MWSGFSGSKKTVLELGCRVKGPSGPLRLRVSVPAVVEARVVVKRPVPPAVVLVIMDPLPSKVPGGLRTDVTVISVEGMMLL
jgi:hypothetical protein